MITARQMASFGIVGIAALTLFVFFPYSPLQDLPEWIYQGYSFNEILSGHPSPAFHIKDYPIPYTLVQLLISASLALFNPMLTSKIVVAVYAALAFWASIRLIRTYDLNRQLAWPVLLSVFILNGPFWSGYIAYQFGLVIFSFYLSLPNRWKTDWRALILVSTLAFLTHGMSYFTVMVTAGAFALVHRRLAVFIASSIPSVFLACWYVLRNVTSAVGGPPVLLPTILDFLKYKLYTFMKIGSYHDFVIFGTPSLGRFDHPISILGTIANFVFLVGVCLSIFFALRRRPWPQILRTPEILAGAAFVCIACVLSPTALGVGNPSERLIYPGFLAFAMVTLKLKIAPSVSKLASNAMLVSSASGFMLSSVGLVAAAVAYNLTLQTGSQISAAPPQTATERTLFGHRMVQFDARMRETDREWRTGEPPTLPLAFDTALLGPSP